MESLTKIPIAPDTLAALVRHALGPGARLTSSTEFKDGWFNTIHGLELADGRRLVLKVAPKAGVPVLRYEARLLATEVEVLRLLADRPGLRVPQIHHFDPDGALLGLPWFLMDWVGLPTCAQAKASLDEAGKAALEASLGRVNRALNAVEGPQFGSILAGGRRSNRWSDVVMGMVDDVLADGADAGTPLPRGAADLRALVEAARDDLDRVTEPRLVHWDLHEGNAFAEDGQAAVVIDADRALWGDPLMEVYFGTLFDRRNFAAGYGPDLFAGPGAPRRRRVYDLYLALVMRIEADFRGFEAGHKAWADGQLAGAIAALEPS